MRFFLYKQWWLCFEVVIYIMMSYSNIDNIWTRKLYLFLNLIQCMSFVSDFWILKKNLWISSLLYLRKIKVQPTKQMNCWCKWSNNINTFLCRLTTKNSFFNISILNIILTWQSKQLNRVDLRQLIWTLCWYIKIVLKNLEFDVS